MSTKQALTYGGALAAGLSIPLYLKYGRAPKKVVMKRVRKRLRELLSRR